MIFTEEGLIIITSLNCKSQRGHIYHEGLNVLEDYNEHESAGFMTYEFKNLSHFSTCFNEDAFVWKVEIPKNAICKKLKKSYMCDKIILGEKCKLSDLSSQHNLKLPKIRGRSNSLCNIYNLHDAKPPSLAKHENFIKIREKFIIKKKSDYELDENKLRIYKLALQSNPHALAFIDDQTEEICKYALLLDPSVLVHVKDKTDAIVKFAERQHTLVKRTRRVRSDETGLKTQSALNDIIYNGL